MDVPNSGEDTVKVGSVRCVLFDLDGTLYDSPEYNRYFDSEMVNIVANFLKVEPLEASRILTLRRKEIGTLTGAMESLGIDRQQFHALVAERINPSLYLASDKTVGEVITRLKNKGLKIGLVTNSGRNLVTKILDALNLRTQCFDAIITGTDVKPKPSHEPFLLALKRIGCKIEETVYVGDREQAEIRPAHDVGLKTVLISRTTGGHDTNVADAVIHEFTELENVIP